MKVGGVGVGQAIGPAIISRKAVELMEIDYEQLLGKLKKHLKRIEHPDILTIRYFVFDYLYPPKNKKDQHGRFFADINDSSVIKVVNVLYDLSPRVKLIIDNNTDKLNGGYTGLLPRTITIPKIKKPFPKFPIFNETFDNIDSKVTDLLNIDKK